MYLPDIKSHLNIVPQTSNTMRKRIANSDLPPPPSGKYPGKAHCHRVAKWIAGNGGPTSGVIYLEGQGTHMTEVSSITTSAH